MAAHDTRHLAQRTLAMCFFGQFSERADHGFFGSGAITDAFKGRAVVLRQAHGDHGHAKAIERVDPEGVQYAGWQVAPIGLRDLDVIHCSSSIMTGSVLGTPASSRSNKASAC